MAEPARIATLREQLFRRPEGFRVYGLLDGASAHYLPQTLARHGVESVCLLRGQLDPDLRQVAPYLARLDPDSPFTQWVLENGWGRHWGLFAVTRADMRVLRGHFRALLSIYDAEHRPLFFRYYDPRVWRVYLPTCRRAELAALFGPVAWYGVEDEAGDALLRYELREGELVCR